MILADKITEERKKNGWSQEELANQLGVSRQAVSKWESAGAVPDLQRILQMSELFCVSTDYLLKDEMKAENITYHESTESYAEPLKKVTMENANEFLDMKRNGSKVMANATSMCILSPILLIVLVTMAEDGVFHVSESLATVFGCVFLLGMVAAAVFLFITYGMRESHMEHFEKECFETEYGVSGIVREKKDSYEPIFIRGTAVGVSLFQEFVAGADSFGQLSSGIPNRILSGHMYWLIVAIVMGILFIITGLLIVGMGYQVGKIYRKYCWDIISIVEVITSTAIAIYFGDWIKSDISINLITLLLLVHVVYIWTLFCGSIQIRCNDRDFNIEAKGWNDYTGEYSQIDSISYEENVLQNDNDYRTNGFGNLKYAMGNFKNDIFGDYIRYTHASCHSYVVMNIDGKILVVNGENDAETKEIYQRISEKVSKERK